MAHWQRLAAYLAFLAAWAAFAGWQYREYRRECELIRETLRQQSHSVMNALVGGVQSHRRLGRFFDMQLQAMLDELVTAKDVMAVAVGSEDGRLLLSAGQADLLDLARSSGRGEFWAPDGYRLVKTFQLAPAPSEELGAGGGPGRGQGGGPGWGRRLERGDSPWPFEAGADFVVGLILDRTRADAMFRSAARSHVLSALAGALVLMCVALVWRASVRLVEARGRAEILETEARHLRDLSQAAAGLAHETRNPLGLVRGWTQRLAQAAGQSPERRAQAQAVIEECDRVTARINQFLAFARPCEPSVAPLDPALLIGELATILQPDLEAKNLRLVSSLADADSAIRADRELLRQALFNLMQNAIQFSPEGDAVEVRLAGNRNGTRRIEVADRGPGVSEESIESLFTPYFTTRADGAGMGLAIVRRIAFAHGWRAGYAPRPGGGAVFSLDGIHG